MGTSHAAGTWRLVLLAVLLSWHAAAAQQLPATTFPRNGEQCPLFDPNTLQRLAMVDDAVTDTGCQQGFKLCRGNCYACAVGYEWNGSTCVPLTAAKGTCRPVQLSFEPGVLAAYGFTKKASDGMTDGVSDENDDWPLPSLFGGLRWTVPGHPSWMIAPNAGFLLGNVAHLPPVLQHAVGGTTSSTQLLAAFGAPPSTRRTLGTISAVGGRLMSVLNIGFMWPVNDDFEAQSKIEVFGYAPDAAGNIVRKPGAYWYETLYIREEYMSPSKRDAPTWEQFKHDFANVSYIEIETDYNPAMKGPIIYNDRDINLVYLEYTYVAEPELPPAGEPDGCIR